MFIDSADIFVASGNGGAGAVSLKWSPKSTKS